MAYIYPDSLVEFFGAVNITPTYENSLYFETEEEKDNYFSNNVTKLGSVSRCSYQRENRGSIRVELPTKQIYRSTYMRFKNQGFENKWFYAFVLQVNYINNVTTEVVYQIDYLMTWMGNFTLRECYVERQHVHNDSIGANICDEGIPCGEYIDEDVEGTFLTNIMNITVVYMNPDEVGTGGGVSGGIYNGCIVKTFNDSDDVNEFISSLVDANYGDNIVNIYMSPSEFDTTNTSRPKTKEYSFDKPYENVGGYVPKNKKMFCYPYKYVEVDNQEGDTQKYLYEYFNTLPDATSSGKFTLAIDGMTSASCELILYPKNYKGNESEYPTQTLGMSHFPMCSWGIDTYKAWLAQQNAYYPLNTAVDVGTSAIGGAVSGSKMGAASGIAGGALGEVLGGIVGTLAGGIVSGGTSYAKDAYTNLVENAITPASPSQSKGQQSCDVLAGQGVKTYVVRKKSITKNYAMMIDNYFTMYGYAIKQVLTPNMNARENYTYVKTLGCCLGGQVPAEDARVIQSIFDNGCRFWKKHTNIGNYSISNEPI
jgi:hypothetical protein